MKKVVTFLLSQCAVWSLIIFMTLQAEASNEQTLVMTTNMECSIWSAPETSEANRVKRIPEGYQVTVYPTVIASTNGDGKTFYQTVKGNYVLCRCLSASVPDGTPTQKQVGAYQMYLCGSTANGTPIYFYENYKKSPWYKENEIVWNWYSDSGSGSYSVFEYEFQYPGHENDTWPQYLIDALNESGVTPYMNDYEKAVTVARYLDGRISYDYVTVAAMEAGNPYSRASLTTYGTFSNNLAVCQGLTNAYNTLLQMLGIECYFEIGIAGRGTIGHSWNKILIGGVPYYTDLTYNICLNNENYLMISLETISKDHFWQMEYGITADDNIWE